MLSFSYVLCSALRILTAFTHSVFTFTFPVSFSMRHVTSINSAVAVSFFVHNSSLPLFTLIFISIYFSFMYLCPCIIHENDERYQLDATIYLLL